MAGEENLAAFVTVSGKAVAESFDYSLGTQIAAAYAYGYYNLAFSAEIFGGGLDVSEKFGSSFRGEFYPAEEVVACAAAADESFESILSHRGE